MLRSLLAAVLLVLAARPAGAYTVAEARAPMTATLVRSDAAGCGADCPEWLALTGKIGFESPAVLRAALARLGARRVPVLLDSPGGESTAALTMGRMIRARGLDTAVASTTLTDCAPADAACAARRRAGVRPGHVGSDGMSVAACASACVLVLAGGVRRDVPASALVGVHQTLQVVTTHPRTGFWRILSRIVGGRRVEVSRTLVITRVLPDRVTRGAPPESLYAAFGRYLAGMGISPSMLPLMRATPPSGIHWLSRAEVADTRIADDAADADALVAREAGSQAAAARHDAALPAALTLRDARRWIGAVAWRVDATAPAAPALVGDWEIPQRHLRGSVRIAADAAPGAARSFTVLSRFAPGADPDARALSVTSPDLCDLAQCVDLFSGGTVYDSPSSVSYDVVGRWRGAFLEDMRRLAWFRLSLRTEQGNGTVALSLAGPGSAAVADWERLCCGFDAAAVPAPAPATPLPAFPLHPESSLVTGLRPVRPAAGRAGSAPRTLDMPALYDAAPMDQHGFPAPARGSVTWFPLAAPAAAVVPGTAALLGAAELPAVGLRVSVEVGASKPGVLGRLTARLHILTDDPSRFGPMRRGFAFNAYDARSRATLLVEGVDVFSDGGGNEVALDIPETGPIAGAFQFGLEDQRGRRVTLAFPFDPEIAALLQSTARRHPADGGS